MAKAEAFGKPKRGRSPAKTKAKSKPKLGRPPAKTKAKAKRGSPAKTKAKAVKTKAKGNAKRGHPTAFNPDTDMNTGGWTDGEHRLFLDCLEEHGNNCAKIASVVGTRTTRQVRDHANYYFRNNPETMDKEEAVVAKGAAARPALRDVEAIIDDTLKDFDQAAWTKNLQSC